MSIAKSGIYTKGGDKGETSLLGGRRVPKHHLKIEAYGTIDELMAHTALLMDLCTDEGLKDELLHILDRLMTSASMTAADGDNLPSNMPWLKEADVEFLEVSIDRMDASLPPLKSFVLPGGNQAASQAHVARTVCRRSERLLLRLAETEELDPILIKYLNRLSDYYFLISRKLVYISGTQEIPWKP